MQRITSIKSRRLLVLAAVATLCLIAYGLGLAVQSSRAATTNGWTPARVAHAKHTIMAAIDASVGSVTSSLTHAKRVKLHALIVTYVDCAMTVIEPRATPSEAFSNTWSGAAALEKQVSHTCEGPLSKGAQALAASR